MSSFELIKKNGHLIMVEGDNLWVLDTGSPASFGTIETINIDGQTYSISESYMGLACETLSENLGYTVSGLIGGDILSNYDTAWDCKSGKIIFSDEQLEPSGEEINIAFSVGIPTLTVLIEGSEQNWFFDTGANISYLVEQPTAWKNPIRTYEDFYPGFGKFSTEVYETEISLANFNLKVHCGILPQLLGLSLSIGGCTGIFGINEFLNSKFYYLPRAKRLYVDA